MIRYTVLPQPLANMVALCPTGWMLRCIPKMWVVNYTAANHARSQDWYKARHCFLYSKSVINPSLWYFRQWYARSLTSKLPRVMTQPIFPFGFLWLCLGFLGFSFPLGGTFESIGRTYCFYYKANDKTRLIKSRNVLVLADSDSTCF